MGNKFIFRNKIKQKSSSWVSELLLNALRSYVHPGAQEIKTDINK